MRKLSESGLAGLRDYQDKNICDFFYATLIFFVFQLFTNSVLLRIIQ